MKLLFILFVLPLSAFAYSPTPEGQCSQVDLRNEVLGDVRAQGKISWCYAFTAADQLAYTFHLPETVSAADIALNYNQSFLGRVMDIFTNNGNPHETGFNKVALIGTMKDGYCPESVFPSEEWIKVQDGQESTVKMTEAMKDIELLHKNRTAKLPFYFKFKNVGEEEFKNLLQTKKLRNFYSNLRTLACQDDRKFFDTRWKVKMVFRHNRIFARINEQMNLGRLVGLDYDARILEKKDHRGVKLSELHTSSIVGRRWNKERNSCEFLIRDSHGVQCTRYDERYDCEAGNVWLSESEIYGSMTSVVYMLANPGAP